MHRNAAWIGTGTTNLQIDKYVQYTQTTHFGNPQSYLLIIFPQLFMKIDTIVRRKQPEKRQRRDPPVSQWINLSKKHAQDNKRKAQPSAIHNESTNWPMGVQRVRTPAVSRKPEADFLV